MSSDGSGEIPANMDGVTPLGGSGAWINGVFYDNFPLYATDLNNNNNWLNNYWLNIKPSKFQMDGSTSPVSGPGGTLKIDLYATAPDTEGMGLAPSNNLFLKTASGGKFDFYVGTTDALSMNGGSATFAVPQVNLDQPAGHPRSYFTFSSGVARWAWGTDGVPEGGSNTGSNYIVSRYTDQGTLIDTPFSIARSTGLATFNDGMNVNGVLTASGGLTVTGAFNTTGSVNFSGPITATSGNFSGVLTAGAFVPGTVSVPNGIYSPGPNQTAISSNGTNQLVVAPAATSINNALNVTGQANLNGGMVVTGPATFNNNITATGPIVDFASYTVSGAAGTARSFFAATGTVTPLDRWGWGADSTAEGGSNAGSNFNITSYSDAGTVLSTPLTINRATGALSLPGGINNLVVNGSLTDNGNAAINGTLTVTGATSLQALTSSGLTVTGNAAVNGAATLPTITGPTAINGNTSVTGTLSVSGAATLPTVTGPTALTGNLTVTGNASVSGAATLPTVTGPTALNGNLTVTGNASVTGAATLPTVTGPTALNGNLTVTGNASVIGAATLPNVTGPTALTGNLTITGNTSITGTETVTGNVSGAAFLPTGTVVPLAGSPGFYQPATDTLGFATSGLMRWQVTPAGMLNNLGGGSGGFRVYGATTTATSLEAGFNAAGTAGNAVVLMGTATNGGTSRIQTSAFSIDGPLVIGTQTTPNAMTVGVNGLTTLANGLSVTGGSTVDSMNISGAAGTTRATTAQTAALSRWQWGANGTAESGASAGSDFFINRYNDAGTLLDSPLIITRSTGLVTILDGVNVTGGFTTDSITTSGAVTGGNATFANVAVSTAAGTASLYQAQTSGAARWRWGSNSTAESGSDAGSDYVVSRYHDAGTFIDSPLTINRATGLTTIMDGLTIFGTGPPAVLSIGTAGSNANNNPSRLVFDGTCTTTSGASPFKIDFSGNGPGAMGIGINNNYTVYFNTGQGVNGAFDFFFAGTRIANWTYSAFNFNNNIVAAASDIIANGGGRIYVDGAAASSKYFFTSTAGAARWSWGSDATAESGSNAGSNFYIERWSDAGGGLGNPLTINRATGLTTLNNGVTVNGASTLNNGLTVVGSTTLAATNVSSLTATGTVSGSTGNFNASTLNTLNMSSGAGGTNTIAIWDRPTNTQQYSIYAGQPTWLAIQDATNHGSWIFSQPGSPGNGDMANPTSFGLDQSRSTTAGGALKVDLYWGSGTTNQYGMGLAAGTLYIKSFGGTIDMWPGNTNVATFASNAITLKQPVSIPSTLSVTGAATLPNITGPTSISGTTTLSNATVSGVLTVSSLSMTGGLTLGGPLTVNSGGSTFNGSLTVTGPASGLQIGPRTAPGPTYQLYCNGGVANDPFRIFSTIDANMLALQQNNAGTGDTMTLGAYTSASTAPTKFLLDGSTATASGGQLKVDLYSTTPDSYGLGLSGNTLFMKSATNMELWSAGFKQWAIVNGAWTNKGTTGATGLAVYGGTTLANGLSVGGDLTGTIGNFACLIGSSTNGGRSQVLTNYMTTDGPLWIGTFTTQNAIQIGVNGQSTFVSPPAFSGSTSHGVLIGEGNSPINSTAAGTTNQVLMGQGASLDPIFAQLASSQLSDRDAAITTFTPVVNVLPTIGDGVFTAVTTSGGYRRMGFLVWFYVSVRFTLTYTTASGSLQISGFPIAPTPGLAGYVSVWLNPLVSPSDHLLGTFSNGVLVGTITTTAQVGNIWGPSASNAWGLASGTAYTFQAGGVYVTNQP